MTLVEMLIAMALAMAIMSATFFMYVQSRQNFEKPQASYQAQEDLMSLTRWITRDLEETNLVSVRSFPNVSDPNEPPGFELESPRNMEGALVMSEYGNVRWQKYVYYTLVPVNDKVGNVFRKEGPLTEQSNPSDDARRLPIFSGKLPSQGGDSSHWKIVARNVVLPNVEVPGLGKTDSFGGLKVTSILSGETMGALPGGVLHEHPIRVDLIVFETSPNTGKPSALTMTLNVMPRN